MHDLGFVSAIMADKPFPEVVAFAADNGFKCIEVMCWPRGKAERRYAGVTHVDVTDLNAAKAKEINAMLGDHGVYISGLGYYPNPLIDDPEQSDYYFNHLKKVVDAAVLLEIPVINTFIGRDHTKSIPENMEQFRKVWPNMVNYAADRNINIGIENCPMFFTQDEWPGGKNLAISPAIWQQMFETIPDPHFGLNYDPSHLIWQMMDEIQPIYEFKDRLHHIHLKDVKLYKDKLDRVGILATPLEYHQPKIPGLGDVRWGDFFSALTSVGYRGPVCVEVEDRAFEDSEQDVKNSLIQSRNYLRQYLV